MSDIINFTQKSNLAESQITPSTSSGEQTLRIVNRYFGTSQIYKEGCTKYNCSGGPPLPKDVETAAITVGAGPSGVAVNPGLPVACALSAFVAFRGHVYVANSGANSVSVIDVCTNTVNATIPVGSFPQGIAVNPNTKLVYVADNGGNAVSVINGTTNTLLTTVFVGNNPVGVAVNPSTNRVYVTNEFSDSVSVINGASNTLLTTIPVGANPWGVDVNPSTKLVYVANSGFGGAPGSTVSVINGTSNTVLTTITVETNAGPSGVAVNPNTNRVYVANEQTGSVSVINGASNTLLTTIPAVGPFLLGVGVNPNTNRVYVTNGGQGVSSVSVIDGGSNTVLNTFTVAAGSGAVLPVPGIGVNTNTNRVYVAMGGAEASVSVIGQREEMREACLLAATNCLIVSSTGTLFPGTPQATAVNLLAISLRSNATKTGTQMALTIFCDKNTTNPNQQCSAFYIDGNVWSPDRQDLTKSPFIIFNAEPYFYLQWHWWDFVNSRIVVWGYWWNDSQNHPNWYWGVYWWWRTYVNYYIGIWLPWWWWTWHWTYWRYWSFWSTNFST